MAINNLKALLLLYSEEVALSIFLLYINCHKVVRYKVDIYF